MSDAQPEFAPDGMGHVAVKEKTRRKKSPKDIPRYDVVLWNDDDHTYGYVIRMLKELFGHPIETGFKLAETVDKHGKAVVLTTTLEHAELKRDQIHAYGADSELHGSAGSMYATIRKCS